MLKKIAGFIVDKRKLLLIAAAVICVISAVLLTQVKVNDDMTDNYFAEPTARFADIEEDEPIVHPLCNEYEKLFPRG